MSPAKMYTDIIYNLAAPYVGPALSTAAETLGNVAVWNTAQRLTNKGLDAIGLGYNTKGKPGYIRRGFKVRSARRYSETNASTNVEEENIIVEPIDGLFIALNIVGLGSDEKNTVKPILKENISITAIKDATQLPPQIQETLRKTWVPEEIPTPLSQIPFQVPVRKKKKMAHTDW